VKDIIVSASLGIPLSLLANLITITALMGYSGKFIEVNKLNAINFLPYGVNVSIATSVLFASLPFVTLFFFRIAGILDATVTRALSIGLVSFGCFDSTHDLLLVTTPSSNVISTVFFPIFVATALGFSLWPLYKRFDSTA
jgi:hypothetical protein